MKVLIITGGDSSERTISLKSANNVRKTLKENKHEIILYDLRDGYEKLKEIASQSDILFPIIHGQEGEGGKLHKFLIKIEKPIVGTRDYMGLQNGWYKIPFKKYCAKNGIQTSPWEIVKTEEDIVNFGFPCVLKASHGGSSREVTILKSTIDLNSKKVKQLFSSRFALYIEKYISGTEITAGVLNGKALPIIEIMPPKGEWFSYKNKYANTKEIPFAPSVPKNKQRLTQEIALRIHENFNFGTYSRIDFIYANGIPYILEANTIPGLTSESLMPKAALAAGISFSKFLNILITNAK